MYSVEKAIAPQVGTKAFSLEFNAKLQHLSIR